MTSEQIIEARAAYQNATEAYLHAQIDPEYDTFDVSELYQAMRRAELKMRSFDVV